MLGVQTGILDVALAAAKAGCHLFIEKPVSHTLDQLDELMALVEQNRLVTMVGYHLRFHPYLQRAQLLLMLLLHLLGS